MLPLLAIGLGLLFLWPSKGPRHMSEAQSRKRVAALRKKGYKVKLVRRGGETYVLRSRKPVR